MNGPEDNPRDDDFDAMTERDWDEYNSVCSPESSNAPQKPSRIPIGPFDEFTDGVEPVKQQPDAIPKIESTIEELEDGIYCAAHLLSTQVTLAMIGSWKREWGHVIAAVRARDIPSARKESWSEPEQPDALALLEAWLAEGKNRAYNASYYGQYGWQVRLIGDCRMNAPDGLAVAAKGPDYAATILAALEKAKKVGL